MREDNSLSIKSLSTNSLSEDYCTCGHLASRHEHGEGACHECRRVATWGRTTRCPQFVWNETWQGRRSA